MPCAASQSLACLILPGVGSETVALNVTLPEGRPLRSAFAETVAALPPSVPDDWSPTWTPVIVPLFFGEPTDISTVRLPWPAGIVRRPSVRIREMSEPVGAVMRLPSMVTPMPLIVVWYGGSGVGVGLIDGMAVGVGLIGPGVGVAM
jgi:hypothetical protein